MFGLGPTEMIVIGVIAVLLFGSKLPDVARQLGGSYRELRRSLNDMQQQFRMAEYEAKRNLSLDDPEDESDAADSDEKASEPSAPKFTPPPETESSDESQSSSVA